MTESSVSASRRQFALAAAGLATVAFGAGAAEAQPTRPAIAMPARPMPMPMASLNARQADMASLSNALFNSPGERAAFLADSAGYVSRAGLRNVDAAQIRNLHDMFASGLCCGGCGCSGVPQGVQVISPQAVRR